MLRKIFDNTNTITGRIASISINLVVIGISTVLLLGAVDTLRTRFKKSKKSEELGTPSERREAYGKLKQAEEAKKCFDNGVVLDNKEGIVKKNLKKKISGPKISEPAGIDKPEDLPAPNTESQE